MKTEVKVAALEEQLTGLCVLYEELLGALIATHPEREGFLQRLDGLEAVARASGRRSSIATVDGIARVRAQSLAQFAEWQRLRQEEEARQSTGAEGAPP